MNNLYKLSGHEIRQLFLDMKLSATDIAKYFLSRCKKHNEQLGAFLAIYEEEVLLKAQELDRKLKEGKPLGKLAAIPIALKDNMHVKGKITTCASKYLENYTAPFDATVTTLLEEADALIIGKTNLDEFAMGSSNENSAFFPAHNPWDIKCVPGGSSGGSCAAVAARLVPIALGSDTGGSIRQPAAFTATLGFKPTYGRVSRHGLVAFASSLDQIGPIANDMKDIGLVMEVIGAPCSHDSTSYDFPPEIYIDSISADLKGKTIGIPYSFFKDYKGSSREKFDQSIKELKSLGASIVDIDLDVLKHSVSIYYILATAEASTNLARFDGIRYGLRSESATTVDQVYDLSRNDGFGSEVKTRIMLGTYVLSAGYKANLYEKAQKARQMVVNAYEKAFKVCDFIVIPTSPTTAFEHGAMQDPVALYMQDIFTIGSNLAGLPAISVPYGFDNNKPLGLQFVGDQLMDVPVVKAAGCFYNHLLEKKILSSMIPPLFDKEAL